MTALLILFGLLTVISLAMFFLKRQEEKARKQLKAQKETRKKLTESRRHPLEKLKINDVVSYVGQDFLVQGKLIFREEGFEWYEFRLVDGTEVRWLEVEEDDGDLWVALYEEVDDLKITGSSPPDEIDYDGDEYELEEKGYCTMQREGDVGRRNLPEMRYFDYEGSGDNVMSIEQWGGNFEVSVGTSISPHAIEIYPGGEG